MERTAWEWSFLMKPEEYKERKETVGRWEIHVVSYRLGDEWICTVDNVSPGANVARATGATREEAEKKALDRARDRLASTRVRPA
jgi:hypothetical protein